MKNNKTTISSIKKKFKDKELFEQALTHRSWLNENARARESNERLEFLGDAILEYVVSKNIYTQFPEKGEGFLTALRSNIVNTKNLAEFAHNINLGKYLHLSKGEEAGGGRKNITLLANTTEALIGAIFIDSGLAEVEKFINKNLLSDLSVKLETPLKDPKSRLQELVQSKGLNAPKYVVTNEEGPDHAKTFAITVLIDGQKMGEGKGGSKNRAEQEAATVALAKLSKNN